MQPGVNHAEAKVLIVEDALYDLLKDVLDEMPKDPDKTEEAMAGGWFHSGDVGVLDEDRYITVADRKKDMVKTGARTCPPARSRRRSTRTDGSRRWR